MLEFLLSGRCKGDFQHRGGPIEFGGDARDGIARRCVNDPGSSVIS